MVRIRYCPLVGGVCNKGEAEIIVQMDTFFLAEPFKPETDRRRRERVVRNALKDVFKGDFSETRLRVADKEPKESIFCDICHLIQSSAYGIVDISGFNPNVLLELGMMFSLGKPVFVLVKKNEEEDLRNKLPSDIVWKRVITYDEFIDIEEELCKLLQNRPSVKKRISLAEEAKNEFARVDPEFAHAIDRKLQELKSEQTDNYKKLEKLLKEAKIDETIPQEKITRIPPAIERRIEEIYQKLDLAENLLGFPENPENALLRGNWHSHRKEYDRALELYDWALTLNPEYEAALDNKGAALSDLGKYEEAIGYFDKALELNPEYEAALNNKGVTLVELGKHEEAIRCYDERLKINPNSLASLENLSEALFIIGKSSKGLEIAKKVLGLSKKTREKAISRFLIICGYFLEGKNQKAQNEIEDLVKYIGELEKGFKVTGWTFSPLLSVMKTRLDEKNQKKLGLLVSVLKGEIEPKDFRRTNA